MLKVSLIFMFLIQVCAVGQRKSEEDRLFRDDRQKYGWDKEKREGR